MRNLLIKPNKYINEEIKKLPKYQDNIFSQTIWKKVLKFIEQVKCDILAVDEKYPKELKKKRKKEILFCKEI